MKFIQIVRGNDTDFQGATLLNITLKADVPLTGYSAQLTIGRNVFSFDNVEETMTVNLSSVQTKLLPLGYVNGEFILFDENKKAKKVTTSVPFKVVDFVCDDMDIEDYTFNMTYTCDQWENDLEINFKNVLATEKRHDILDNRDLPDQHPIEAITGLRDELDGLDKKITDNIGRGLQVGYDGSIDGDVITFSGETYDLKHGYDYEVDLYFDGELYDKVQLVIKNGEDLINIMTVAHFDPTEPATVWDLRQIMQHDPKGYRWIFKARYNITPTGEKVFVMPNTVANCLIYEEI